MFYFIVCSLLIMRQRPFNRDYAPNEQKRDYKISNLTYVLYVRLCK
jgi:hypothetical protein